MGSFLGWVTENGPTAMSDLKPQITNNTSASARRIPAVRGGGKLCNTPSLFMR